MLDVDIVPIQRHQNVDNTKYILHSGLDSLYCADFDWIADFGFDDPVDYFVDYFDFLLYFGLYYFDSLPYFGLDYVDFLLDFGLYFVALKIRAEEVENEVLDLKNRFNFKISEHFLIILLFLKISQKRN
jgi:hypothetical protein